MLSAYVGNDIENYFGHIRHQTLSVLIDIGENYVRRKGILVQHRIKYDTVLTL
jgi:hypothetical protein